MYWVYIKFAQKKDQTRCNANHLFTTHCQLIVSRKVVVMESGEIIYQRVFVSPRPPPKISYKDNRMCDLDSDIVGSSKDTQRIQPKTQLSRTERPVGGRTQSQTLHGEDRLKWFKNSPEYRVLDRIDSEPMELAWNIFPRFTTWQLCHRVQELFSRLSVTPEKFTGRIIFMSMFNDISWGSKDNEKECESNAQLVSLYAKRFSPGTMVIPRT